MPKLQLLVLTLAMSLCLSSVSFAGAYIFAGEPNGADLITHPNSYSGTGGIITVRVCIDPASANAAAMEIPIQNNTNILNRLQATTANLIQGGANNIPDNSIDFESVALHELGHCIGLAHVNAASESGLAENNTNYTKATSGANNTFDINPGSDGIIGSADDIRGDDDNLHWYRRSNNNPFTLDNRVDSTTYARALTDLQGLGHSFAANADRSVATLLGFPNTEAVMQQGTFFDEAQRTLAHDDVATLLYAASGVDELSGTADDYSIRIEYGGISNNNCDISLSFTNTTNLAFCSTGGVLIAPAHARITTASIEFGNAFSWFFNTDTVNRAPILDFIGDQTLPETGSTSVVLSATDPDGDTLQYSVNHLPPFANLTDHGDGTATLDISPTAGDAGLYPVTIDVLDDGLPVLTASEGFNILIEVDSDGDGLSDTLETTVLGTNPNDVDSDGDGLVDGAGGVVAVATLPGGIDTDEDGFVDGEQDVGTDPGVSNRGDVAPRGNPDSLFSTGDVVVLTRLVTGAIQPSTLEAALADINSDGRIDVADLLLVQKIVLQ